MAFFEKSPKSIDVEELVRRCIINYADKCKFSVYDDNDKKCSAIEYNQQLIEELSKSIVKSVFGVLYSQLSTSQLTKNSNNQEVSNLVERLKQTTYDGLTYEDKKVGKRCWSLPTLMSKQSEMNEILNNILSELSRLSQVQETVIRENSAIIQKQHDSLLRYDNDLLYKSKNHLLNEVIGIADQIKQIEEDQIVKEDFSKLLEDVHALGEWVGATLQTESVRKYEYANQDKYRFDSKYQEIVETQYTSVPEEDNTYKTMLPGYFWTIPMVGSSIPQMLDNAPKSFEFILRHEQVIRFKYKPASTNKERRCRENESSQTVQSLEEEKTFLSKSSAKTKNINANLNQQFCTDTENDKGDSQKQTEYSAHKNAVVFDNETHADNSSNGQSLLLLNKQVVSAEEEFSLQYNEQKIK